MKYRIAVASSDGLVINQHFGHADKFHITELDTETGGTEFIETREVTPCCVNFDHTQSAFDAVLKTLHDTQVILVARIGGGAEAYLIQNGMTVYEAPYLIPEVLAQIIAEKRWEADKWRFPTKN